ncbi:MAG TPA: TorF family putative porin [Opitutaceae bacterium]|nr:TorF family putative porin [Opitutaceae bacterium]
MNKKITALILSVLTMGALASRAQTGAPVPAPAAPSVSVTLTPAFVSQYMFRGQRLGGTSFQPVVEATYGNLGLGVWSNFPLKDEVPGVSDPEIDPYGYYTFTVSDSLSIVPGFTYYTYPNADSGAGFYRSSFEPSLAVNYTIAGVKFTPKIYYDVTLDGPTLELSAFYAVPLKDLGTELDFSATYGEYIQKDVVKNSAPATKAWGKYWSVGVTMPYQLTKNTKLVLGLAYAKGEDSFVKQGSAPKVGNSLEAGRTVGSVSYSYTF